MRTLLQASAPLLGDSPADALHTSLVAICLGGIGGYSALTLDQPLAVALAVSAVLAACGLLLRLAQHRRRSGAFARAAATRPLGPRIGFLLALHVAGALAVTLLVWWLVARGA